MDFPVLATFIFNGFIILEPFKRQHAYKNSYQQLANNG
jgi:hypothetical protein